MKKRLFTLLLALVPIVAVLTACPPVSPGSGGGGGGPCVVLAPSIDTATTLKAGCYLANADIQVSAALTLDPGVTIEFAQDTEMDIVTNSQSQPTGSITAIGTSAAGGAIVLRGQTPNNLPTPGLWAGINIYTNNPNNRLEYVEVRDTGDPNYGSGVGVYVASGLPFTMKHTTIDYGKGIGFAVDAGASAADLTLQANTYDHLVGFPVSLPANAVGALDPTSQYTNNSDNAVEVFGGPVDLAQTWQALKAPYRVDQYVSVNASLTIAPGSDLQFTNGTFMDVNAATGGVVALTAVGTPAAGITFEGAPGTTAPATWGGINLYTGSSGDIEYATVSHAGGTGSWLNAAINVASAVPFTLEHSVINGSVSQGLAFDASTAYPDLTFLANTYSNSASFPVSVTMDGAGALDPNSTYLNNFDERVEVFGNSLSHAQTWHNLADPYYVDGSPSVDAALTIAPGTTVQVDPSVTFNVSATGTLIADGGSSGSMITFTTGVSGSTWGGIDLSSANDLFNYVVVEQADSYGSGEVFTRLSGVQIDNSIFQNSPDKAICWDVNAQPTTSGDQYIAVDTTPTQGCLP